MSIAVTALLAAACALLGAWLLLKQAESVPLTADDLVDRLDRLLPQTQCGQCTFSGCRPYAAAMAAGKADINQCPPGGDATARRLANALNKEAKPVDPRFGDASAPLLVAVIDENRCIGCALCLPACPVDAIVGAARHTHTVIARECTGCKLCLPPCPVDCIEMQPLRAAV
jgi:electron transport complex protein RnfB